MKFTPAKTLILIQVFLLTLSIISPAIARTEREGWLLFPDGGSDVIAYDHQDSDGNFRVWINVNRDEFFTYPRYTNFLWESRLNSSWGRLSLFKEDKKNYYNDEYPDANKLKDSLGTWLDTKNGAWFNTGSTGIKSGKLRIYINDDLQNTYKDIEILNIDGMSPVKPERISAEADGNSIASGTWHNYTELKVYVTPGTDPIENEVASGVKNHLVHFTRTHNNDIPNYEWTGAYADTYGAGMTSISINMAGKPDGTYYMWAKTQDKVGNLSATQNLMTYKYDTTSPTIILNDFESGYTNSKNFNVSWSGNDGVNPDACSGIKNYTVEYKKGQFGSWQVWQTVDSSITQADFDPALADEETTYYFRVTAKDNAGNEQESSEKSIMLDTTPPTSWIENLPTITSNTFIDLSWNGNDAKSLIDTYTIQYQDPFSGEWVTYIENTPLRFAQFPWAEEHPNFNGEVINFRSIARDRAGNVEDETAIGVGGKGTEIQYGTDVPYDIQVTVDFSDAAFTWQAPTPPDGETLVDYTCYIDTPASPVNTAATSIQFNGLEDGYHSFYVSANYSGGIPSGAGSIIFLIDINGPGISAQTPLTSGSTVTIIGEATDNVRLNKIEYDLSSPYLGNLTNLVKTCSSSIEPFAIEETLEDGSYTIIIRAIDEAGQESDVTQDFTINARGPILDLNAGGQQFHSNDSGVIQPETTFQVTFSDGNGLQQGSVEIIGDIYYEIQTKPLSGYSATETFVPSDDLPEGSYTVNIVGYDAEGTTSTMTLNLQVFEGSVRVEDEHYGYPNPFDPAAGATIKYFLTAAADIDLVIYNINGQQVRKMILPSLSEGGNSGWNNVPWDGKDNFGKTVPNGAYYYFILAEGKVLAKGEMAAYK